MIGKRVGHYEVLAKLGEGGMGVVYKARDTKLNRFVALKFLPSYVTADDEQRERFRREAQSVSSLDHPNICTVYEIGKTDEDQLFISMAYYDGGTLKSALRFGSLPLEKALKYAVQIARGLSRAHEADVVHRDVKPANIAITSRDEIKVLDFGLAKLARSTGLTRTGTTMGTVSYMSPEQALGDMVDHRTDLWSLGIIMYEMLAGQTPYHADNEHAIIYAILNREPPDLAAASPDTPAAVIDVVKRALKKNPKDRYRSADELLADLEPLKAELAGDTPMSGTRTQRLVRPRRGGTWTVGLVGLAAALAAAAFFLVPREAPVDLRSLAIAARDSAQAAERGALVAGADAVDTERLLGRAQHEFDDGRYDEAASLFRRATDEFDEAREAREARNDSKQATVAQVHSNPPTPVVEPAPKVEVHSTPVVTKSPTPDRSAEISRERDAVAAARRDAEAASAERLATPAFAAARQAESDAEQLAGGGDADAAIAGFQSARRLYVDAEGSARRAAVQLEQQAATLERQVGEMSSSMPADIAVLAEYRAAVAATKTADGQAQRGDYESAVASYETALAQLQAATSARQRQVDGVNRTVYLYASALEAEDLSALSALHIDFTRKLRSDWSEFFGAVDDLRAKMTVDEIRFTDRGATAALSVQFLYSGARAQDKVNKWEMDMREEDGNWLISDIRRKS